MNVELPETLVLIESIVYKSNGFAIGKKVIAIVMNAETFEKASDID